MAVTLREAKNKDGSTTFYLDIIHNGKRKKEYLSSLKIIKSSNPIDRQRNKENRELARRIFAKRAQEMEASEYQAMTNTGKNTIVVDWLQSYIDKYTKADKRNMQGALNHFKDFLQFDSMIGLTMGGLKETIITDYRDYLNSFSKGEGGASYFARFKKMIKRAYKEGVLLSNPAEDVKTIIGESRKKDILTLEEIKLLSQTPIQSPEVKRAFLFSCMTGLRWCDVKVLDWAHIDLNNQTMSIVQEKTAKGVSVPLNNGAIEMLGTPPNTGKGLVFTLPSSTGANKTIKAWVKRAGISKAITWHNARHSFGTNLIFNDVDVLTASKLLGHSSLTPTQRYVDTAKEMKITATNKINIDF